MMEDKKSMPQVFLIKNKADRNLVKNHLLALDPVEVGSEKYCEYIIAFIDGKNRLLVKQYESGKVLLQGKNDGKLISVLKILEKYKIQKEAEKQVGDEDIFSSINMPVIGTDESGKGDYFGPLVVCAMWADEEILKTLIDIGVKDSKMISDKKCIQIAKEIREYYSDRCVETILMPPEYNLLYKEFKSIGKSLNQMLGYLHAQSINQLFLKRKANTIIVDKFGKESDVLNYLDGFVKKERIEQLVCGERNPVVAAASILARDRFIQGMQLLSEELEIEIPFGAGTAVLNCAKEIVINRGSEYLNKCAKVHFVITEQAMKASIRRNIF